jgi:hypothetical protein
MVDVVLPFGGGDSSSSSSTTTSNTDKRQVVSDYGVGVSSDSSTVNVSVTDQGAFSAAVDLAKSGADDNVKAFDSVLGLTNRALDKHQGAFSAAVDLAKSGADNNVKAFDSVLGLTNRALDKLLDIQMRNQALQGAVLERSQDPDTADKKNALLIVGVVAGAIVLVYVFGKAR